jgi:ABC-type bacteriocin/lantibiotic exporter with double-glycine peptidase domain
MKSMLQIINEIKDHVFKWGSMQNSLEIFNNCAPVEKHIDIIPSDIPNGFVLKDITYSYNDKYSKPVFDHYNLVIELNKITLVVGEIGSGKSTLIKLLMKYQLPQEGTIYYNKRPYSSINVDELRTIIGYVPQVPVLFNRTVYENIVYNNTSVTENDVFELMKQLGIDDMIYKFKDGLQTNVGIGGSKLSGGQRQIVWLLRIILQNPEVIILDEPTSALDDDTKPIVQNMIKNIIKNKTIIMITHDKYLYQFADTIVSL